MHGIQNDSLLSERTRQNFHHCNNDLCTPILPIALKNSKIHQFQLVLSTCDNTLCWLVEQRNTHVSISQSLSRGRGKKMKTMEKVTLGGQNIHPVPPHELQHARPPCPCLESSLVLLEEAVCYDYYVLLAKLS